MIDLSQSQSEDQMDNKSSLLTVKQAMFRNYSVHYHHLKKQIFHKIQSWTTMIKDLGRQRQGFQSTCVLTFLSNIQKNDQQHRLSQKQLSLITKEIVELFGIEINRILSEKDNEYQMISQRNNKMFRELNRLNQLKGSLYNSQKLIGLEIFAYLLELNEKFKRSKPEISRLVGVKTIAQITRIKQIGLIEASLKLKWEENYAFLDKQIQGSSFGMLSEILFLVHMKRKISYFQYKNARLQFNVRQLPFQAFLLEQKYAFRNSDRFKYKFCQLVGFSTKEKNIKTKTYLQKGQINRKIEMILERSQYSDQRLELHDLMLQNRLTFRSLSQWINNLLNEGSIFPRSQFIVEQLEKYQWSLLKSDRIETNFQISGKKNKNDPLGVLSSQNFVGQSICKIALERFRTYASILKIQNKLMKKIEKGTSLYIRRFQYSYDYYYNIHHQKDPLGATCFSLQRHKRERISLKEENNSQQNNMPYQEKSKEKRIKDQEQYQEQTQQKKQKGKDRKMQIFTVILGFSERKNQFAFKYDQQLSQNCYTEHLVNFLKTKHEKPFNIFLSELDFERTILSEQTIVRMVQSFRQIFNTFLKFEVSPSKFFYHLLVHTYVDKCLGLTPFETKEELSELLSTSLLRIIKLINYEAQNTQVKINDHCQDQQQQSCDSSADDISQDSCKSKHEKDFKCTQCYHKYDQKVICEKIHYIMMKKLSISLPELQRINWQGKKTFLKKKILCQYYVDFQDQSHLTNSKHSENSKGHPVLQHFFGIQQEIMNLQRRFLEIFKKHWPFLTDLQVSDKVKNVVSFVRQKNTSLIEIKRLLRNIARNLLIYQAYFNELCCSKSEASKRISNKYWKQVNYLSSIYSNEVENLEKIFPSMHQLFFLKLLKNLVKFPVTSKKIRSYYNTTIKNHAGEAILKVQQKEQQHYPEPCKRLK